VPVHIGSEVGQSGTARPRQAKIQHEGAKTAQVHASSDMRSCIDTGVYRDYHICAIVKLLLRHYGISRHNVLHPGFHTAGVYGLSDHSTFINERITSI